MNESVWVECVELLDDVRLIPAGSEIPYYYRVFGEQYERGSGGILKRTPITKTALLYLADSHRGGDYFVRQEDAVTVFVCVPRSKAEEVLGKISRHPCASTEEVLRMLNKQPTTTSQEVT